MFFAERQTAKIPDVPEDTPVRQIKSAAVIGAGTMGGGIAMNFANAGIPVSIMDMTQEAVDKGVAKIKANYASTVSKAASAGGDGQAHGADKTATTLEAGKDRRHRHRGGIRAHGREEGHVQEARCGDEAGRDPRRPTPRRWT
jgi:hypothetical protein